jgi:hypothetical protein
LRQLLLNLLRTRSKLAAWRWKKHHLHQHQSKAVVLMWGASDSSAGGNESDCMMSGTGIIFIHDSEQVLVE